MPIDTSMYGMLKPLDIAGSIEKGMSLRQMADDRAMKQKMLEDQAKIKEAYQAGAQTAEDGSVTYNPTLTTGALLHGGYAKEAQQFQAEQIQNQKTNIDNQLQRTDLFARTLGNVKDAQSWENEKANLIKAGVDIGKYKDTPYDPAHVDYLYKSTISARDQLKAQADAQKEKFEQDMRRREILAKEKEAGIKSGFTAGQKKVDQDFASDYNEWTSGGSESARAEIQKLQGVAEKLKNKTVTTGGLTGMLPDRITSNEVLSARADVQSTIMKSLRSLMGASFTEKEGERVIKNTWNEADSTENNLVRLNRLATDLMNQADAKDAKGSYFQQSGSLSGYRPSSMSSRQANNPKSNTVKTKDIEWAD